MAPRRSDALTSSAGTGNAAGAALVPAPAGLRPLTLSQYQDTLADLLGEVSLPVVQAETSSVAASLSGFSPLLVEQFGAAALSAAEQAFAPDRRAALVGCSPGTSADDLCVRQFLSGFGRRAFRRALEATELEAYASLSASAAAALGDAYAGLQAAVAAFLESPHFLYERHRQNPTCAGCHALTDPLGLALEHFDALGGYRADEDGLPIDTNGDLDGAPFQDARGLGARLAERPETMGCLVRQLFRFGAGHVATPTASTTWSRNRSCIG